MSPFKALYLACANILMLAILNLPIGYYNFLRIIIIIETIMVFINEFKNQINAWLILFAFTRILFNPILPLLFHEKVFGYPL